MFRKPTRVSLFPETPTMHDALCTHNTTGFVFNMCVVPTMHFALYNQSEYIPIMQAHPMKHYTPNRNIHPQFISPYTPNGYIHPQLNSNYTPYRNIDPQCIRLCVERVYRSCTVSCFLCVLFVQNNGGKDHAHHIGIRRGIAEVPIRT